MFRNARTCSSTSGVWLNIRFRAACSPQETSPKFKQPTSCLCRPGRSKGRHRSLGSGGRSRGRNSDPLQLTIMPQSSQYRFVAGRSQHRFLAGRPQYWLLAGRSRYRLLAWRSQYGFRLCIPRAQKTTRPRDGRQRTHSRSSPALSPRKAVPRPGARLSLKLRRPQGISTRRDQEKAQGSRIN